MNFVLAILMLLFLAAPILAIIGIFKPKMVLWWAPAENQTKGKAFFFAATLTICLFFGIALFLPGSVKWWVWILAIACFGLQICLAIMFSMTKEQAEQLAKEQELKKKMQITRTAYSHNSDREYEMHPFFSRCSCPDWEKKRCKADGPFAVCKHLANYYLGHKDEMPEELNPYIDFILYFSIEEKGLPPQGDVYGYGVIDDMAYIFTGYSNSLPWVNVYIDVTGTQRYGYNMDSGKWASGEEPFHAELIANAIQFR